MHPLVKPIRIRHRLAALGIRSIIAVCQTTWRYQMSDEAGITSPNNGPGPVIWTFWHNRVLAVPTAYRKYCRHRQGSVLTSPSDDGAILAASISLFGLDAVRGSSSKRGGRAILELEKVLSDGKDIAITPDGPRGPRYRMSSGLVRLATRTNCQIMPIHVEFSSYWRLNSWDGFAIPKPGARISICFAQLTQVNREADLEAERARLESLLTQRMVMH